MTITKEEAIQKNRMAMRLEDGEGVPINQEAARKLFREAAEAGLDAAQNNIGYRMYYARCGFSCDVEQAIEWFKRAAAQELPSAVVNLFNHYKNDDPELAERYALEAKRLGRDDPIKWLDNRKARSLDEVPIELTFSQEEYIADRIFKEGMIAMHGQNGHVKNPVEAVKKFKRAEAKGNPYAAFELGQCYRFGRGVERDLDKARTYLEKAEKIGITGAIESLRKINEISLPADDKENNFIESVELILSESNLEIRFKKWRDLASSYSTENATAADGRKAFHIGALALAGCSNSDGRQDIFNALYWFQHSTNSKFIWGHLGQALIDQQNDRKKVARNLLGELDRPFNIEELLLHKNALFNHIQEYCIGLSYISSLLILFASVDDNDTYAKFEGDWRVFLDGITRRQHDNHFDDSEGSQLFSGILFERLRLQKQLDEYDLEDSRRNLYTVRNYLNNQKFPDEYSATVHSAINACLVEIERTNQDVVRREVEGRVIALQSHTLNGPLGNALRMLADVKRWYLRGETERVPAGIVGMESNLGIIRNLVEANNLILLNHDQFNEAWQQDSESNLTLAQVICEAAQQAILRLNAKEFRLEKTGRKLLRSDVNRAAMDLSMLDFSAITNINSVRNGFVSPFEFIKVEFDMGLTELRVGADGIRRQFFFAMAHELIFNAIKYDSGSCDIQVKLQSDNGCLLFTCRNGCFSESERAVFRTSHQGHDFLKQIFAKMRGLKFEVNPSATYYEVKLSLGTYWSDK